MLLNQERKLVLEHSEEGLVRLFKKGVSKKRKDINPIKSPEHKRFRTASDGPSSSSPSPTPNRLHSTLFPGTGNGFDEDMETSY